MTIDVTPDEADEHINKIAEYIHKSGLDVAAILMIETVKPLSYIGGQLGRLFLSPILLAFGQGIELGGEKFLTIFEQKENIEKLLKRIEKLSREEEERKKEMKDQEKAQRAKAGKETSKYGWRRFFPFKMSA